MRTYHSASGSSVSAVAENYPYKSDVLWVTVPNHADWLYKTGEKVTVEVQFYKYADLPSFSCMSVGIPRPSSSTVIELSSLI